MYVMIKCYECGNDRDLHAIKDKFICWGCEVKELENVKK